MSFARAVPVVLAAALAGGSALGADFSAGPRLAYPPALGGQVSLRLDPPLAGFGVRLVVMADSSLPARGYGGLDLAVDLERFLPLAGGALELYAGLGLALTVPVRSAPTPLALAAFGLIGLDVPLDERLSLFVELDPLSVAYRDDLGASFTPIRSAAAGLNVRF